VLYGVDRSYTICPDLNSQCRVESVTGLTYPVILDAIRAGNRTVLRQWLQAVLVDPADQTLDQVGEIIDDVGGSEVFAVSVRQAAKRRKGTRGRRH
jgi:hypothetical protein